jgi:hypothetical protein
MLLINSLIRQSYGPVVALLFCLSALAPYGCKQSPFDGLKEGKVIYDVTVEGDEINPMMKAMMPGEIITYFGNDRTCTVISAAMNMMETRLISDAANYSYTTLVSAMGKKVAMVLNKKQVEENYLDRVNLKITYTGQEKEIAGILCKEAMVTDSTNNTYPVYYTEELAVKTPNWSTPFRDINGLLMEYSINMAGMRMNLRAREIVNETHDPSMYQIPEGYEIIDDPKKMKFGF